MHAGLGSDASAFLHKKADEVGVDLSLITDPVALAVIREQVEDCIEARRLNQPEQKRARIAALKRYLQELVQ